MTLRTHVISTRRFDGHLSDTYVIAALIHDLSVTILNLLSSLNLGYITIWLQILHERSALVY